MDRRPFFVRNPKWQIVFAEIFCLLLYSYFTERLGGVENNRLAIGIDFAIFMAGLLFWPFFFAQFVLPVRTLIDRYLAFRHLDAYLFGMHGPAERIQDGKIVQHEGESRRKGQGVLILDANSAAVLRTDVAYTRAVGPGIVFLNYNRKQQAHEYIAGTVDLQIHTSTLGPTDREDPFAERQKDESEDSYRKRLEHRNDTSGKTRDNIEVVPNISVTVRLQAQPGEGGTGFGYNPISVWRAITSEGVDPGLPHDDARRAVSWQWLPVHLAADVWREYLRMFTMKELFNETYQGRTGREIISDMLSMRLTQPRFPELNDYGRPTGRHPYSPEYNLLNQRGLKVISAIVTQLRFQPGIDDTLISNWESSWLQHARQERESLEYQRSYVMEAGQRRALLDYANGASQLLPALPVSDEPPECPPLLKCLVQGTLNLTIRDPQLHQRIQIENSQLIDLLGWLEQNPGQQNQDK